jgi:hypothetical protein
MRDIGSVGYSGSAKDEARLSFISQKPRSDDERFMRDIGSVGDRHVNHF